MSQCAICTDDVEYRFKVGRADEPDIDTELCEHHFRFILFNTPDLDEFDGEIEIKPV